MGEEFDAFEYQKQLNSVSLARLPIGAARKNIEALLARYPEQEYDVLESIMRIAPDGSQEYKIAFEKKRQNR